MPIPTQAVIFGYGEQPYFVGKDGTFVEGDIDFLKVRSPRVGMGTVQSQQVFPPELGGVLTPDGAYKDFMFFGGSAEFIPRLENSIGWLLKGAMGICSTATDENADGDAITGLNTHTFTFAADGYTLPNMAFRHLVPAGDTGSAKGEIGYDCKIGQVRLTIPAMGKLAMRVQVVGRDAEYSDGSSWTWVNSAFEEFGLTPDAGRGHFKIEGEEYEMQGAVIDIINGITRPQDGAIVGDYHPVDFTALSRGATIRMVYRWKNIDLWNELHTGSTTGTSWSPLPFISETAGAVKAFEAYFQSPQDIAGTTPSTPAGLKVFAEEVVWAAQPIELRAGGILQQTVVGTVMTPDSGDYLTVQVENATEKYDLTDLAVRVDATFSEPAVGADQFVGIEVENFGPDTPIDETGNVTVSAPIPTGLTYVSENISAGSAATYDDATGIFTIPASELATMGDRIVCIITATVDAGEEGNEITYSVSITSHSNFNDTAASNDTDSDAFTVAS